MYCRDCISQEFYIAEHAAMYALMVKAAQGLCGELGMHASIDGTILYAQERGARMAARALADGKELTMKNYLLYGEWDDHLSWSENKVRSLTPVYKTDCVKCGWCSSWKKLGLLRYGEMYCTYIDRNLVKGFNPELELDMGEILSHGGKCCEFIWNGANFPTASDVAAQSAERAKLLKRVTKDFLYHTAHLYSAMKRTYQQTIGEKLASEIAQIALDEFEQIFSGEKKKAILMEASLDFTAI